MDERKDEDRVERKVVYENVSETTSRGSIVTIIIIAVIALGLVIFILMHLR